MARDKPLTESPEALPPQRGRRAGDLDLGISFQDIVESSRIITEAASDAIITIDQNSRILFVNRATVNIFGYSMEEMLGAELTMLMPEYLRRLHRAGLKNYLETGKKTYLVGGSRTPRTSQERKRDFAGTFLWGVSEGRPALFYGNRARRHLAETGREASGSSAESD